MPRAPRVALRGSKLPCPGCVGGGSRPSCPCLPPGSDRPTEQELTLLLARPARALDAISSDRWPALLDAACRHGLLAALAGRLPPGDAALRARFERLATAARLRDAALRAALEEVLSALAGAGVVTCPLKGPLLADRVYPDPALRPSGDLDLLVPEPALERAAAALAARGFRLDPRQGKYQRRHGHHLHLDRAPGPAVELHFRPQSGFRSAIPGGELLARARAHASAAGNPLLVLAPEDELLSLSLHAAKHLVERQGWLLDLLLLLERHPSLDWPAVAARARLYRCSRATALVLHRVQALGGAVPDAVLAPLEAARARVAGRIARAALDRPRGAAAHGLRIAHEAVLCDGAAGATRLLAHHAWWFLRRSAHRGSLRLTRSRGRRGVAGPS